MEKRKSLKDISWNVTEEEYRADSALSYSILARYEREGFNSLDKLFDKIESPSLTFGSIVDTLVTGSDNEFDEKFLVAELTSGISDTQIAITKRLFSVFSNRYNNLKDIPDNDLIDAIQDIVWNNHWLPKTRANKIKTDCAGYYSLLYIAGGRTIVSTQTYNDAVKAVDSLKTSDATKFYFEPDNMFDDTIQRYYQLKFKANISEVDYRCMADLIIVNHKDKVIIPVDLKTSSKPEWDFYKSFIEWRYDIQAHLYTEIIKYNLQKDDYFKHFRIADYKFIVVNRNTLTPLVWNCDFSKFTVSSINVGKNNQIELRNPFLIGDELNRYLRYKPKVPNGINLNTPNNLREWLNKL